MTRECPHGLPSDLCVKCMDIPDVWTVRPSSRGEFDPVAAQSALVSALDQIELAACVDKDPEALRTAMIHIGELARDALKGAR
jgi:hypothetical protein